MAPDLVGSALSEVVESERGSALTSRVGDSVHRRSPVHLLVLSRKAAKARGSPLDGDLIMRFTARTSQAGRAPKMSSAEPRGSAPKSKPPQTPCLARARRSAPRRVGGRFAFGQDVPY